MCAGREGGREGMTRSWVRGREEVCGGRGGEGEWKRFGLSSPSPLNRPMKLLASSLRSTTHLARRVAGVALDQAQPAPRLHGVVVLLGVDGMEVWNKCVDDMEKYNTCVCGLDVWNK